MMKSIALTVAVLFSALTVAQAEEAAVKKDAAEISADADKLSADAKKLADDAAAPATTN